MKLSTIIVFGLLALSGCGTGPDGYAWGNAARGLSAGLQPYGYQSRQIVIIEPQPTAAHFAPWIPEPLPY